MLDITESQMASDPTASQIFISGGLNNLIVDCTFQDNVQSGEYFLPSLISAPLKNFFSLDYF